MGFPRDIVKLITSYLPSKQLLPLLESIPSELLVVPKSIVTTAEAQNCKHYFWGNPNVFEAGIFSESELPTAPKHLIARNPACVNYVLSNWDVFKHCPQVWRNPGLWECLKPHLRDINRFIDYHELAKNPHPEAIRYVREIGMPVGPSNPGYVFKTTDFKFHEGKRVGSYTWDIWANPLAVPFLKEIVANKGTPLYAFLRENPHPWAVQEYLKYVFEDPSFRSYRLNNQLAELIQNAGIFESVDFPKLQLLLETGFDE